MEEDNNNRQQGGGRASGVRIFLKNRSAGSVALRIRYQGGHPQHGQSLGGVPVKGGVVDDGESPVAEN